MTHLGVRRRSVMFFIFFVSLRYRQDRPEAGSSAGIAFTRWPIFGFFAPQGRHVAPIKGEIWQGGADRAKFHLDRFRGVGLRPKKL